MRAMPDLREALAAFDGRSTTILSELQSCFAAAPDFHAELVALLADPTPHVADGASWVLKAEQDAGRMLAPALVPALVETLPLLSTWQAQLHLCQILAGLELSTHEAEAVLDWAMMLTDHKRPFLRAWSLHVIVTLARGVPDWADRAEAVLNKAMTDPAASVRARARNLRP